MKRLLYDLCKSLQGFNLPQSWHNTIARFAFRLDVEDWQLYDYVDFRHEAEALYHRLGQNYFTRVDMETDPLGYAVLVWTTPSDCFRVWQIESRIPF